MLPKKTIKKKVAPSLSNSSKNNPFFEGRTRFGRYNSGKLTIDLHKDEDNITNSVTTTSQCTQSSNSRLSNVQQAQKCLEIGENEDFSSDFEYFLSTLKTEDSTENAHYLSLQSIVKKSTNIEFRNFLRRGNHLSQIFSVLKDKLESNRICAATSVFIYFMARDKTCFNVDGNFTSIIMPLLKIKPELTDTNFNSALKSLWPLIEDWAKTTSELTKKKVDLGLTKENFNTSFLTLEGLALVCMHKHNPELQKALFNIGCLQWIVAKVEKLTKKLLKPGNSNEIMVQNVREMNRCMRILETNALYNKQNQTYLMTCGNCSLLQSCSTLFELFHNMIALNDECLKLAGLDAICVVGRVLMNLTHDNELCCAKLGNMNNFLELCLLTISDICPKYAGKEKKFDIILMACALIVNMAEKSTSIRKRIINMEINVYDSDTNETKKEKTLSALAKMFSNHESAARTVDEEFDKELEFEDAPEEDDEETNTVSSDGRLHREELMGEDDAFRAMQAALSKVNTHMEDSVFASYFGLVLGCLIQRDSESASYVKSLLPGANFTILIEQLNRFKEFMEITHKNSASLKTLERIIGTLQGYNALL